MNLKSLKKNVLHKEIIIVMLSFLFIEDKIRLIIKLSHCIREEISYLN